MIKKYFGKSRPQIMISPKSRAAVGCKQSDAAGEVHAEPPAGLARSVAGGAPLAGSGSQGPSLQGPAARALKFKFIGPARPARAVTSGGRYPWARRPVPSCDFDGQVQPAAILPRRWRWISDRRCTYMDPPAGSSAGNLTCNWKRPRV